MTTNSIGLLLSDDLIFISRITGVARDLGMSIKSVRNAPALVELARSQSTTGVMVDLANPGLDLPALLHDLSKVGKPFVVAYGSHVDAAGLRAAREAGCDLVLPRSKFVEDLPRELPRWLGVAPAE